MLVRQNEMGFIQSNGRQLILINSWCLPATLFRLFANSVAFTSHKTGNQIKICKTYEYILMSIFSCIKRQCRIRSQDFLTISGNYHQVIIHELGKVNVT